MPQKIVFLAHTPASVTDFDLTKTRAALVISALVAVTANAANLREQTVVLRVKPVLCVTDKRNQHCEISFNVQWESELVGNYCLHNDFSAVPLNCWAEQSSGSFDDRRVIVQSFNYWLTTAQYDTRLAEASIEVMTTESSDRRRQRRNRHAWSIL